jgi:hypothetical protein
MDMLLVEVLICYSQNAPAASGILWKQAELKNKKYP